MTRKIKALCLALFAVLALGAVAAQGASAESFVLQEGKESAEITGEGTSVQKLLPEAGAELVECQTLHLSGSQAQHSASAVELTPEYSNCNYGELPVTVTDEGCKYVFSAETTFDPNTEINSAPVSLNCNHEGRIAVHIYANAEAHEADESLCTFLFEDTHGVGNSVNQGLHGVVYDNETVGEKMHIKGTAKVHNVKFTTVGGLCFLAGFPEGTYGTGIVEGDATIKAYETGHAGDPNFQIDVTKE